MAVRALSRLLLFGRSPVRTLARALILGAGLLLTSQVAITPVRAHGISMLPAYYEQQLLWVNRFAYRFAGPVRGDVVAIRMAGGGALLIKRVVGLPGERVRIDAGIVMIDGKALDEPYVKNRAAWQIAETVVGPDQVFVIGDNRGMPARAHDFGLAPLSRLAGRLAF